MYQTVPKEDTNEGQKVKIYILALVGICFVSFAMQENPPPKRIVKKRVKIQRRIYKETFPALSHEEIKLAQDLARSSMRVLLAVVTGRFDAWEALIVKDEAHRAAILYEYQEIFEQEPDSEQRITRLARELIARKIIDLKWLPEQQG